MNRNLFHLICFFTLICVLIPIHSKAQNSCIDGKVTNNGEGIANVVVTDGNKCVLSDKKGHYSIPASANTEFVYVSTPSGYLPQDSLNIPRFYQKVNLKKTATYNFELKKNPKNDNNHLLLVHADPQFFKEGNFDHYSKVVDDCLATINENKEQDVFGIDCGDLAGDRSDLYPKYIDCLNRTNVPFYRVLGNHDMNYGGRTDETSTKTYNQTFGPAYYSFNRGKVHYIILDNVFYFGRDYFYMGYIDERIFQWLEQDLSYIPKGSTVFLAMHIPACLDEQPQPFSYNSVSMGDQTVNASSLFNMLKPYHVHILTGHMHYNRNIIHSTSMYEHNTGATCGTWWQGDYCLDGAPIGYGVYQIDGDKVSWYFKSAGHPRDYQMRAYPVGSNTDFPEDISVNVWNWDKNWKVEWLENGINQGEMIRCESIDPEVAKMCADKEKLEFKWIGPIKTDHIFRATPQNKNAMIEIRVTDSFNNVYKTTIKQ